MWPCKKKILPETLLDSHVMAALPVFREKIVLLGDPLSGKSSLVDRYISNKFSIHQEPTWSVRVGTKSWAISDPAACILNVELWDTPRGFSTALAGEDFWRGTRAVVVCVDGQNSACSAAAARWLTGPLVASCRQHEPNAVVCLVATKVDGLSERRAGVLDEELQAEVDKGHCSTWAKVSAKEMTGRLPSLSFSLSLSVFAQSLCQLPRGGYSLGACGSVSVQWLSGGGAPRQQSEAAQQQDGLCCWRTAAGSACVFGCRLGLGVSACTGIYDTNDFLKQLLHALVSKELKAPKSRVRRSLLRPRQSVSGQSRDSIASGGRPSIASRASVTAEQLKEVAIRFGSVLSAK
ncbi:hypothetical protein Efla_006877 [Eimeria flavescens]